MVFSSLLFIYIFLPANLVCYALFSDIRKKNICILLFSLLFYSWSSPMYLLLLIIMAFINYIGAGAIDKYRGTSKAVIALVADLTASLGILGYFKYFGFFAGVLKSAGAWQGAIPQIVLPVGISFYTFQLISYVADVYKGSIRADKSFGRVLLYTSLFHQCIAGPIVRYKDIANDLMERKTDINSMSDGISRFCMGLAKKTLLANSCASILDMAVPEGISQISSVTILAAWLGGILYMLQIYLDFSAYSDMAIGLGKMTGFHYRENFNYPYTARSVTDFWRRWHISLSTFFRDYVYIPLGGNRKGIVRQIFNMLVVWALTGLWHGADYNFVLWGLYYFVFLAIEKLFLLKCFERLPDAVSAAAGRLYTFIIVFFGWVIFRFTDLSMAGAMVKSMFGLNGNRFTNLETNTLILNNIIFIAVCILACTPIVKKTAAWLKNKSCSESICCTYAYNVLNILLPGILLFLSTIALIGNSYNPFIYFRF
ncbi:MAG: MBOAT family O-acyltransferase [Eubacteriales bacterium]|nr:MBOAT family O-acyltransferase [Eubacteriales bacterium]